MNHHQPKKLALLISLIGAGVSPYACARSEVRLIGMTPAELDARLEESVNALQPTSEDGARTKSQLAKWQFDQGVIEYLRPLAAMDLVDSAIDDWAPGESGNSERGFRAPAARTASVPANRDGEASAPETMSAAADPIATDRVDARRLAPSAAKPQRKLSPHRVQVRMLDQAGAVPSRIRPDSSVIQRSQRLQSVQVAATGAIDRAAVDATASDTAPTYPPLAIVRVADGSAQRSVTIDGSPHTGDVLDKLAEILGTDPQPLSNIRAESSERLATAAERRAGLLDTPAAPTEAAGEAAQTVRVLRGLEAILSSDSDGSGVAHEADAATNFAAATAEPAAAESGADKRARKLAARAAVAANSTIEPPAAAADVPPAKSVDATPELRLVAQTGDDSVLAVASAATVNVASVDIALPAVAEVDLPLPLTAIAPVDIALPLALQATVDLPLPLMLAPVADVDLPLPLEARASAVDLPLPLLAEADVDRALVAAAPSVAVVPQTPAAPPVKTAAAPVQTDANVVALQPAADSAITAPSDTAPRSSPFDDQKVAVSEKALDGVRGGFVGDGVNVSFGIERAVYVNGSLVTTTSFNVSDLGRITAGRGASAVDTGTLTLVQNGAGNVVSSGGVTGSGAIGTVVQNTLDGQKIQNITTVNATVNSLSAMRALNLQSSIRSAVIDSLRR